MDVIWHVIPVAALFRIIVKVSVELPVKFAEIVTKRFCATPGVGTAKFPAPAVVLGVNAPYTVLKQLVPLPQFTLPPLLLPQNSGSACCCPVAPVGPVAPVAPTPVAPVAPVGPVTPVAPVAPVGPVAPICANRFQSPGTDVGVASLLGLLTVLTAIYDEPPNETASFS